MTSIPALSPQIQAASRPLTPPAFGPRLVIGLIGVLIASLAAGFNGNVISVALNDVRGAMSLGYDQGRWLSACYDATQVAAMAFAPWCAVTFSLRRFTLFAISGLVLLGILCPLAPNYETLLVLRTLQGLMAGFLPPLLMTVALRFLPPHFKLYGLAGYALTATFGPNLSAPLSALWTDYVGWQFLFWQVVPLGLVSLLAVAYGLPQDPLRLERFRQFDWVGLLTGFPGICAVVIAILQGDWLGWFHSPLISSLLIGGTALLVVFFINESVHPLPFFGLSILRRRNFTHALITLAGVLIVLSATMVVPSRYLAAVQGYRPLQTAPVALIIALPQLIVLPLLAALCNRRWVDCRWVMGMGLALCIVSLLASTRITADWSRTNFYSLMALQVLGQPMVVIALLMSSTGVVDPMEGPVASAWFNTVKAFAAVLGTGVLSVLFRVQGDTHMKVLLDQLGNHPQALALAEHQLAGPAGASHSSALALLAHQLGVQAQVLATADVYRCMAILAGVLLILIPLVPTRVFPPRAVQS